ncbi:hypothetical protein HYH03_004755 [Edaphochlamys debaryana]|uniref:Uncharacterized protein n=1 Tax=Edaphochlamys debaryana TaxID=47281 RepID=A0A835YE73_9CHLO|nr:hypothetical protein HYH03_004755 [Edaphochlamys debaryana]|eukprot:KAG2497165.1 hypothetical protein HYH03_004755 [Edaphochlamys debaryana]
MLTADFLVEVLLPVPDTLGSILLTHDEAQQLAAVTARLDATDGLHPAPHLARSLGLRGAFVALDPGNCQSSSTAVVIRRLQTVELHRGEVRVGDGSEVHPLAAVLPGPPTAQQWREACRELAGRLLRGEAEHMTAAELRSVCERLAVLQRCAAELPAPGQPLDAARRKALEGVLSAPMMDELTWALWRQELGKWRWDAERAAELAATGEIMKPGPEPSLEPQMALQSPKPSSDQEGPQRGTVPVAQGRRESSCEGAAIREAGPEPVAAVQPLTLLQPDQPLAEPGAGQDTSAHLATAATGPPLEGASSAPLPPRSPDASISASQHPPTCRPNRPSSRGGHSDWRSVEDWAADVDSLLMRQLGYKMAWEDVARAGLDIPPKFRGTLLLTGFLGRFGHLWTLSDPNRPKDQPLELTAIPPGEGAGDCTRERSRAEPGRGEGGSVSRSPPRQELRQGKARDSRLERADRNGASRPGRDRIQSQPGESGVTEGLPSRDRERERGGSQGPMCGPQQEPEGRVERDPHLALEWPIVQAWAESVYRFARKQPSYTVTATQLEGANLGVPSRLQGPLKLSAPPAALEPWLKQQRSLELRRAQQWERHMQQGRERERERQLEWELEVQQRGQQDHLHREQERDRHRDREWEWEREWRVALERDGHGQKADREWHQGGERGGAQGVGSGAPPGSASDRDWPQVQNWAVDVYRYLLTRVDHTAPVAALCSVGLAVPRQFLDGSVASFLSGPEFRALWSVGNAGLGRPLTVTAAPGALQPWLQAQTEREAERQQERDQDRRQEQGRGREGEEGTRERDRERQRQRDKTQQEGRDGTRRSERSPQGRRPPSPGGKPPTTENPPGSRGPSCRQDTAPGPRRGLSSAAPQGSPAAEAFAWDPEADYVRRLALHLAQQPGKSSSVYKLSSTAALRIPWNVLRGRRPIAWFKSHLGVWTVTTSDPVTLTLRPGALEALGLVPGRPAPDSVEGSKRRVATFLSEQPGRSATLPSLCKSGLSVPSPVLAGRSANNCCRENKSLWWLSKDETLT